MKKTLNIDRKLFEEGALVLFSELSPARRRCQDVVNPHAQREKLANGSCGYVRLDSVPHGPFEVVDGYPPVCQWSPASLASGIESPIRAAASLS